MNPALRTLIVLLSVATAASASETLPAMQIGSADYAWDEQSNRYFGAESDVVVASV